MDYQEIKLYKFFFYSVKFDSLDVLDNKTQTGQSTEHIIITHPTSYGETMLHIFRANVGSGVLAMGDAFKNGGIIFATITTVIIAIICVHAQHLLLNCSNDIQCLRKMDKSPGFADTVQLVFEHGPVKLRHWAKNMRILTDIFLCFTQLGFCCVYIVFIANNSKAIFDQYIYEVNLSIHMTIVVILILISCMVRKLKYLTPFSIIANILMMVGVSIVIYKAMHDLPPVSSRPGFSTFHQLPLYFGTAIYAFEGIGLVLPLKNEMKDPAQFQKPFGVLNVSMTIVTCIFIIVGFFGYLKWGEDVKASLTLNLEPGDILSPVVQGLLALAILFTYPLQFYVPVNITWSLLQNKFVNSSYPITKERLLRAFLVLVTFILAECIPHLGLFISLVGAISSTTLALILPSIIEIVSMSQKPKGITLIVAVKNFIIISLSLYIFTTGTYQSIYNIILAFQEV